MVSWLFMDQHTTFYSSYDSVLAFDPVVQVPPLPLQP